MKKKVEEFKGNKSLTKRYEYIKGQKFPPVMYGLEGVQLLFDCSKATASRYVNSFLSDSITKKGNKIIIDTFLALKCFGVKDPSRFLK